MSGETVNPDRIDSGNYCVIVASLKASSTDRAQVEVRHGVTAQPQDLIAEGLFRGTISDCRRAGAAPVSAGAIRKSSIPTAGGSFPVTQR